MYFLILKKGWGARKKNKGYTDMYVQPNIGTPVKQPISTLETQTLTRWMEPHTAGWYFSEQKAWDLDWFGKKGWHPQDKQALIPFFFFVAIFSLQYQTTHARQTTKCNWVKCLFHPPHLAESFPIGSNWGMRTNGFLMLLSLVMSSYTCWECCNLPALFLLSEYQTNQPDDWTFVEIGPVLTIRAWL